VQVRYTVLLLSIAGFTACQSTVTPAPSFLGSWRLVQFQGGDDTVRKPRSAEQYVIEFAADHALSARIDCNRGLGTWKSSGPTQLELGALALTRMMCSPESMDSQLLKHWPHIRSYTIKNDHLFLSLLADGGSYEFERSPTPLQ
jgi:para-nitrobenzyl esterase